MPRELLTFQSFNDAEVAADVAAVLRENNIIYSLENATSPIDPVIIGTSLDPEIKLKIAGEDFSRAGMLLDQYYNSQLGSLPSDYYLFSFSDNELRDIISAPDEWGRIDYLLAQKLLKERGREISTESSAALKKQRITVMAEPGKVETFWIVAGYFIAVFLFIIGVIYSSSILSFKKTLPDGVRVYGYRDADRKHALNMLVISSVLTILAIIRLLYLAYD